MWLSFTRSLFWWKLICDSMIAEKIMTCYTIINAMTDVFSPCDLPPERCRCYRRGTKFLITMEEGKKLGWNPCSVYAGIGFKNFLSTLISIKPYFLYNLVRRLMKYSFHALQSFYLDAIRKARSTMLLHHGWKKLDAWKWPRVKKFNFYYFKVSSPRLKNILNYDTLKWLRTSNFNFYSLIASSLRLKKILDFNALKWLRTNKFNFYSLKVSSPWLKKILNSNSLKRLRTNKFIFYFLKVLNNLNHDWRKFWITKLWNSLERIILFSHSIFTMVEENYEF